MKKVVLAATILVAAFSSAGPSAQTPQELATHRNLGKAFYENPTTQTLAVDEFKKALDLAPNSARERVNYALSLLRAAKTAEGVAELQRAQQQDPSLPHTWFNLGIAYKKDAAYEKAIVEFEQMVKLVPGEAVSHYNLGYLYKLTDKPALSLPEFEKAAALNPNLAGPHFQLFNAYKDAGRDADAAREQAIFQDIKRRQAGAVIPEDLDWSPYAEILDPIDPADAADNAPAADLKFADTALPGAVDTAAKRGLITLDADADGRADLLVWSAAGIRLFRNGTTPVDEPGLADVKGVTGVAVGDFNNDGLPDLVVLTDAGPSIYTNGAGARFTKAAIALPSGRFSSAVWVDYDHDYDADLLLFGDQSVLLRNNGQAGFSDQSSDFPFIAGQNPNAAVLDLVDTTSGHDIVVTYSDRPGVIYRDKLAGKYEATTVEALKPRASVAQIADLDNDGSLDLIVAGQTAITVLMNRGDTFEAKDVHEPVAFALADVENRGLTDVVAADGVLRNTGLGRFTKSGPALGPVGTSAMVAADFDNDGRTDLALIGNDGVVHVLTNQTQTPNKWIRLQLTGVKNAKLAPQAQIEVKAGPHYQKKPYEGVPVVFGLGGATSIDTIRITWPNGLIQNELRQPLSTAIPIKEAQRLSGSCPMIFTWNGKGFQFITDVLGVAPLGASSGDGTYFPVDHDEYVQIPGSALVSKDGEYEVRVTEELREVSYLDKLQLIAVDHPSRVEVFTNDKFKSPPFPEFRLFGGAHRVHAIRATEDGGQDVTSQLAKIDRVYPADFPRDFSGVAERHALELDFGTAAPDNKAVLILNGWLDWADGSTFMAQSQQDPRGLQMPSLQVKDEAGKWVTVIDDMGVPAGKPKTIAVDMTGKFLSASREVRIVTNACIYWDEISLLESSTAPEVRLTPLDASSADLHYRGFSTPTIDPERTQPEAFDYAHMMPLTMWNPTPGLYTRYGDVLPLATRVDDKLILMGSGDEITLKFPAALPALAEGWTRDFLLLVDGWAKDADANTAYPNTVEPLPFHAMSGYPYPATEHFPDDGDHDAWRTEYNTRPALRLIRPLHK